MLPIKRKDKEFPSLLVCSPYECEPGISADICVLPDCTPISFIFRNGIKGYEWPLSVEKTRRYIEIFKRYSINDIISLWEEVFKDTQNNPKKLMINNQVNILISWLREDESNAHQAYIEHIKTKLDSCEFLTLVNWYLEKHDEFMRNAVEATCRLAEKYPNFIVDLNTIKGKYKGFPTIVKCPSYRLPSGRMLPRIAVLPNNVPNEFVDREKMMHMRWPMTTEVTKHHIILFTSLTINRLISLWEEVNLKEQNKEPRTLETHSYNSKNTASFSRSLPIGMVNWEELCDMLKTRISKKTREYKMDSSLFDEYTHASIFDQWIHAKTEALKQHERVNKLYRDAANKIQKLTGQRFTIYTRQFINGIHLEPGVVNDTPDTIKIIGNGMIDYVKSNGIIDYDKNRLKDVSEDWTVTLKYLQDSNKRLQQITVDDFIKIWEKQQQG